MFFLALCSPELVNPDLTVGLIRKKWGKHGFCQNIYPLYNFTRCSGHCDSFTEYNAGRRLILENYRQ